MNITTFGTYLCLEKQGRHLRNKNAERKSARAATNKFKHEEFRREFYTKGSSLVANLDYSED